jgi:putative oxidoreductase
MSSIPNTPGSMAVNRSSALPRSTDVATTTDTALLLIRLMVGAVLLFHGSQKLFGAFEGPGLAGFAGFLQQMHVPQPMASAVLAGGAEFLGGAVLVLGFAMRILLVPAFINMVVAILLVHRHAFDSQKHGMEYPLTLAVVLFALMVSGPGRLSLSGLVCRGECVPRE